MHPEIRQDHPGACPICGMALEPEIATEATGPSAELIDMTRRFWIALALSIPVFALEMGGHLAGPASVCAGIDFQLDSVGARDSGRALGGLAVLRARLGVAQEPQSQHVHADRLRRRRRVGAIASSPPLRRASSRRVPRRPWRRGRLFRSGGGHHDSCPARTGAGAESARTDGRRDPRAHRSHAKDRAARPSRTARTRRSRSTRSRSATSCACGRARRSRWTAKSSRGEARSMNPC